MKLKKDNLGRAQTTSLFLASRLRLAAIALIHIFATYYLALVDSGNGPLVYSPLV